MNNYQKALIEEHHEIYQRVVKLGHYINSNSFLDLHPCNNPDDLKEVGYKYMQFAAMQQYCLALESRLELAGIVIDEDGNYLEKIAIAPSCGNVINKEKDTEDTTTNKAHE